MPKSRLNNQDGGEGEMEKMSGAGYLDQLQTQALQKSLNNSTPSGGRRRRKSKKALKMSRKGRKSRKN
jgi:hypothetical protein